MNDEKRTEEAQKNEGAHDGLAVQREQKVALVHDFLLYPGGAEHVLRVLADMYPDAPIYTLLYDQEKMGDMFADRDVRTSFLGGWPQWLQKHHQWLLPFYGSAVEAMDLREFDLVISSSGAWSKGLVTRLDTKHIAYIHSPMRYVWDENERYMKRIVKRRRFIIRQILSYLRVWDHQAAQRPDVLIANSQYTHARIAKYYRRDADVVYPPVSDGPSTSDTVPQKDVYVQEKPFLVISRLNQYKNVALAVEVCHKLQLPLIVVGDGPQKHFLESIAGPQTEIRGWVSDAEKWQLLHTSRALLFPCEDDFGIVCVESLIAGTPVVALGRGGAREIVRPDVDGILFADPTVEVMADGLRRFLSQEDSFEPEQLRTRARTFSRMQFETRITDIIGFS